MPRIFDNIDQSLLPALRETLAVSNRADFCVGYFNLRGWKQIDDLIERFGGLNADKCRLLIGMQPSVDEELRAALAGKEDFSAVDQATAMLIKRNLASQFKTQLTMGRPTDTDQAGLRRLAQQLRDGKVAVKVFTRHLLHAKLYLMFRPDPITPRVGYLGSSNLTMAGLSRQGELNVDVVDQDACEKLAQWFIDRWEDRWSIDISEELAKIIESSWAGDQPLPYYIYLKIAFHLSEEARDSQKQFKIPIEFKDKLFQFQEEAVRTAAGHINRRSGVLLGDVVGLGKTLMATAVAKIYQSDHHQAALIICPKNLVPMWEHHREEYRLDGKVLSLSMVSKVLPNLRGYQLVIIDESHNLRNREGSRYQILIDYIRRSSSRVMLLSATPYNKVYTDLGNQLRLFLDPDRDIGVRPELLIRAAGGEQAFQQRFQRPTRCLGAFEKSEFPDDWRDLMKLFTVRRTRGYIQEHYGKTDPVTHRRFLAFPDGRKYHFPDRIPITMQFPIDESDPTDQYAALYSRRVVDVIDHLDLPRYGLGNYVEPQPRVQPTPAEQSVLDDLSRAGSRLKGFCRTNLFKRLESSGSSFLQSITRHVVRNFVTLTALEEGLPVPIGTQDAALLDDSVTDSDGELFADPDVDESETAAMPINVADEGDLRARARSIYEQFAGPWKKRFKWLPAALFTPQLSSHLRDDAGALRRILEDSGSWNPQRDRKLDTLLDLIRNTPPPAKVLVFTQFSDTAVYLAEQLKARGVDRIAAVTGGSANPTQLAKRFSPMSNEAHVAPADILNVLIATDVLSEGQNLQDCACVVNFDLPWAIIRLIQRAGRVDRIGQSATQIRCCTFLPADGVERIICLRARVRQRLRENAEVIGSDEAFFEDQPMDATFRDLFNQTPGILDGKEDTEVDLGSMALGVWNEANKNDAKLVRAIMDLPNVVFSTKSHRSELGSSPAGVLAYVKTAQGYDALAWVDAAGELVSESKRAVFEAAACKPDTPTLPQRPDHHTLVSRAIDLVDREEKHIGGALGPPSSPRARTYNRLREFDLQTRGTLMEVPNLSAAIEQILKYPLHETAHEALRRQLSLDIPDEALAAIVVRRHTEGRLCHVEESTGGDTRIICSMGLVAE